MVIGKRLRYYRKRANLTQEELAEGICATTYISKVENGKTDMPDVTLAELCKRMGITLKHLTGEEGTTEKLLLNNWYKEITLGHIDNANKLFYDLKQTFREIDDPLLLVHYYLISLRYFLFTKKKQKAKEMLLIIENMEKYIPKELEHFYYAFFGLYEYYYGNLRNALKYYKNAEKLSTQDKNNPELMYRLALVYSRLNQVSKSIIYCHKALETFYQEMKYNRCTDCYMLQGINMNLLEDYELAEDYFKKVLNAAESHQNPEVIKGKAYHNLGNIYSRKKQPHQSIEFLLKSLEFKSKSSTEVTSTLYLLAKESFAIGEQEKAKEWLSEGLRCASNDREYRLKLEILQFQICEKVETENYRDTLKEALSYLENRGSDFATDCAELLAHYYDSKNHYKNAYYYLQLANALKKKNKY